MPVVLALLRQYNTFRSCETVADCVHSHIKGQASHKIISDGELPPTCAPFFGRLTNTLGAQHKTCYVT